MVERVFIYVGKYVWPEQNEQDWVASPKIEAAKSAGRALMRDPPGEEEWETTLTNQQYLQNEQGEEVVICRVPLLEPEALFTWEDAASIDGDQSMKALMDEMKQADPEDVLVFDEANSLVENLSRRP